MANLSKLQCITLTGMFGAIIFLMAFFPMLGFPQIPLIGSATVIHIPVIIGAILMGPKYGAVLGFMFGLSSLIFASTMSIALNSFAFTPLRPVPGTDNGSPWALLIAFGPRILVGVTAPLVYAGLMKVFHKNMKPIAMGFAAGVASMVNTLLVLNLLYFIFREPWSYAREVAAAGGANIPVPQITYAFIASTIVGFGIPEAIAAVVIVPAVCMALFAVAKKMPQSRRAES